MDYILEQKVESGELFYLVKWSYKTHQQNSWVKQSFLIAEGHHGLIEEFANNNDKVSYSENVSKQDANDPAKKKFISKRQRKRKINFIKLTNPSLKLPVVSCVKNHWYYGDRIKHILQRNDEQEKYLIEWQDGERQWADQETLLQRQPRILCLFMQKQVEKLSV